MLMLWNIPVHVDSWDQTKRMAKAVITFKLMPEAPDTNLSTIKDKASVIAKKAGAIGEMQVKEEPIAFGLKAVVIMAMYEVQGSDFEGIANQMSTIKGVQNAEVAKMDLALG